MANISRRAFGLTLAGAFGISHSPSFGFLTFAQSDEPERSQGSITDVPGVKVGHYTDSRRPTGCTAILFEDGATGGVDYDGSGPEDFQAGMLQPESALQTIWGIMLSGGDSWGLSTALGAMRYQEEHGRDRAHSQLPAPFNTSEVLHANKVVGEIGEQNPENDIELKKSD